MMEIRGRVNTAVCYAKLIEYDAVEQIRRMCDYELTAGSRIRIMPDVHAGKGCTIGTTMTVTDKVCPNIVGVDIGCGMYTVALADRTPDFKRIDEACHYIPSGMNVWENLPEESESGKQPEAAEQPELREQPEAAEQPELREQPDAAEQSELREQPDPAERPESCGRSEQREQTEQTEHFDLTELRCFRSLKKMDWLERSLGTLGGGNHFIEIDQASDGTCYLVIHSGSRNLGKQVAEIYQQLAIDLHAGRTDYLARREEIIRTFREEGKTSEIQTALHALREEYAEKTPFVPEDLCWLYGPALEDYLHDVEICQAFARRSREKMAEIILERAGLTAVSAFHTVHNYIDTKEMILRKGAIAAHAGEKVLIPINMRDGSVLAVGRGNPEWNESAPHGAGRLMSRTKARTTLSMEEYRASMKGIYSTTVNQNTIDEAPMVYKSLEDIIDVIRDSVDVLEVIRPVYNFKAADDGVPRISGKR